MLIDFWMLFCFSCRLCRTKRTKTTKKKTRTTRKGKKEGIPVRKNCQADGTESVLSNWIVLIATIVALLSKNIPCICIRDVTAQPWDKLHRRTKSFSLVWGCRNDKNNEELKPVTLPVVLYPLVRYSVQFANWIIVLWKRSINCPNRIDVWKDF